MSHDYRMVQWTPFKRRYDVMLGFGVALFLAAHVGASLVGLAPGERPSEIQIVLRALGAAAFALLSLILAIGPLARFSPRFLPLLYNRRHLGVTCFLLAVGHAGLVLLWYHGFSDLNPLVSLLASNRGGVIGIPFEALGLLALAILFVMAATSHDFWNTVLGPSMWKAIHMAVYLAYLLAVGHVLLGAAQGEKGVLYAALTGSVAALVALLHLAAGVREGARDRAETSTEGWIEVGDPATIEDGRARIVTPPEGERIAVFRKGEAFHAVSNVCRHQGGPLGEGRIVDGCITCPWHGFQYRPEDGRAPPPFTERIATYPTRLVEGRLWVRMAPEADSGPDAGGGEGAA
jgi:methionine sulfoxide reductase heme-binding subunit